MVDVTRDGRFFMKTWNVVKVPHDGDPYTVFAKIIPPYVSVERAWVHNWYTGVGQSDPWDKQEIMVTMGMTNIEMNEGETNIGTTDGVGTDHGDDDVDHLNGFVGGHMPLSSQAYTGITANTSLDKTRVGLNGGQPLSLWYKDRMIGKQHNHNMGLGKNAIMTAADKIRFCVDDYWGQTNVSGHTCSIQMPRLIAMQAVTDVVGHTSGGDPEWLLTGTNDLQVDTLTSDAWFLFGESGIGQDEADDHNETPASVAAGIPSYDNSAYQGLGVSSQFENWASFGWTPNSQDDESGFNASTDIVVQSKITLECRTLKPSQRKLWTPN